jgi:hypothetical protein
LALVTAYATVDELAAAVRTRVTPTSTPVLERCLDSAAEEIDHYLDAGGPVDPVPALVKSECLSRAVEWYKANDAALGILGYNDSGTLTPPASTFDRHAAILVPLVDAWGIA